MALTAEQLEERMGGLGGSDAAIAVGLSSYSTPLQLYMEKTRIIVPDDIGDVDAIYWGNRLEDIIIEEYSRRTENVVMRPKDMLRHPKHNFMTANLDGFVELLKRVVEAKTANLFMAKEWGELGTDEIPITYLVQTQHYLSVTGSEIADVAVLIGGQDYRIYEIPRDDDLITNLIEAERAFWQRVLDKNPPAPTNNDDLKLIYSKDNGLAKETTEEILDVWGTLKEVKAEIKQMLEQQEDLEFKLKKYMAESTTLTYQGSVKPMATWKTQDNNRFQGEDFKQDYPDLHAKYTKNSPSRVLRLKK